MVATLFSLAVDCGTLNNPTNGRVDTPQGTTFEQTASYTAVTAGIVWLVTQHVLARQMECGPGVALPVVSFSVN